MAGASYHDLQFDAQCLTARRRTGGLVRFTHQERALLRRFMQAPQRLLTRSQLLAALAADGDVSERSVDYLVTHLRAKLGDSVRRPRFIRTQYGEGYVWVATPGEMGVADAFIAIGPAGGHAPGSIASCYLHGLRETLAATIPEHHGVALSAVSPMQVAAEGLAFGIDAGLHEEDGQLRGVLALRHGRTQRMLAILRVAVPAAQMQDALADAALQLKAAIWRELASSDAGPSDEPAYVRLVTAEHELSSAPVEHMREGQRQLDSRRALRGDEPRLLLEQANLLLAQQVLGLGADGAMAEPVRSAIDAEIESLTMAALPYVQDEPMLLLTAAKLLIGMGPGPRELAQAILDTHFSQGAAFATTMSLRAQLRMYRGDPEGALPMYDACLGHAAADSDYRVYLLILKAMAFLALARRDEVAVIASELHVIRPETRHQLSPMHYAMATPDDEYGLAAVLATHDAIRMRDRVAHLWYMFARHFETQAHRVEFMRCMMANALASHGEAGVGADVWQQLPELRRG